MLYIGLDPGVGGGLGLVDDLGIVADAWKMPETERDLLNMLRRPGEGFPKRAVLERVHSSPQMGVVSAFTFGRNYGMLRMALVAAGIPFDEVSPQAWQTALGCLSRGDKNVTKRRAQELFPKLTITHANADALLIAEYCRRLHRGSVQQTRRKGSKDGKAQGRKEGQAAGAGTAAGSRSSKRSAAGHGAGPGPAPRSSL